MLRRCCPWASDARTPELLVEEAELSSNVASGSSSAPAAPQSKQGMDLLMRGYWMLDSAPNVPDGFKELLNDLRVSLGRLEGALAGAASDEVGMVLPWPKPSRDDEKQWQALCPTGGRLLRSQVCVAAEGESEEYFVGRLFVSEAGLLFEACAGLSEGEQALNTKLVHWPDVVRWAESKGSTQDPGSMNEIILTLRDAKPVTSLRLQLGFDLDCKCLHEVWRMSSDNPPPEPESSTIPEGDEGEGDSPESPDRAVRSKKTRKTHFDFQADLTGMAASQPPERSRSGSGSGGSFDGPRLRASPSVLQAAEVMPSPTEVKSSAPLCTCVLRNASLDKVRMAFERDEEWPLVIFTKDILKGWDITCTPWAEGVRAPGLMRRLRFKLAPPDDTPPAVARMVGLPKFFENVMVFRLYCTENEVALVSHTVTLNMSFGDATRVQEVVSFTPNAEGGVSVKKWVQLVVVKTLPFMLSAAKSFLEKKVKSTSAETWDDYSKLLERLCAA